MDSLGGLAASRRCRWRSVDDLGTEDLCAVSRLNRGKQRAFGFSHKRKT
jgi:hypothetical protein